jgi:hypothetical protein
MTDLSRRASVRRSGRRPGWLLLTALLVLAIGASSALVFTNRAELLKLAVILALWAAIVAAFVSVIYRRQSDVDQARVRDLKLVYDLQLDREISARREYELTVESQLRRELASELRAQAADEVAALRAELAALRTNLEILFDTDLTHRPALETDRTTVPGYSDWAHHGQSPPGDWVSSSRVTSVRADDTPGRADDSSIIDVPEEPLLPPRPGAMDTAAAEAYQTAESYQGSHWQRSEDSGRRAERRQSGVQWEDNGRRPEQHEPEDSGWHQQERYERQPQRWPQPRREAPPSHPEPRFEARHVAEAQPGAQPVAPPPQAEPQRSRWDATPAETPRTTGWQPVDAQGQWLPPETPGSNWVASRFDDVANTTDTANGSTAPSALSRAATPPQQRRGRHASSAEPGVSQPREADVGWRYGETGRRAQARHSTGYDAHGTDMPAPPARHRGVDPSTDDDAPQSGGQSVADLLARLHAEPSGGGGRRRRREG